MFIHDSACVYGCKTERRSGVLLCQVLPRLPISDQLRCAGEINTNLVSICVVKRSETDILTAHRIFSAFCLWQIKGETLDHMLPV